MACFFPPALVGDGVGGGVISILWSRGKKESTDESKADVTYLSLSLSSNSTAGAGERLFLTESACRV